MDMAIRTILGLILAAGLSVPAHALMKDFVPRLEADAELEKAPPAKDARLVVSGVVTKNGLPVPGAKVTVVVFLGTPREQVLAADEDGRYSREFMVNRVTQSVLVKVHDSEGRQIGSELDQDVAIDSSSADSNVSVACTRPRENAEGEPEDGLPAAI
jgi:hypothetical protein